MSDPYLGLSVHSRLYRVVPCECLEQTVVTIHSLYTAGFAKLCLEPYHVSLTLAIYLRTSAVIIDGRTPVIYQVGSTFVDLLEQIRCRIIQWLSIVIGVTEQRLSAVRSFASNQPTALQPNCKLGKGVASLVIT